MIRRVKTRIRCVICDIQAVEWNHVGGRRHVGWLEMPFCKPHHDQFHALARAAGINLEYTPDPVERKLRALQLLNIAQWMLTESLKYTHSQELNDATKSSGATADHS